VALKVDYVVKETGRNLVRNPLLSLATIVVVVVAVALVGGSLLVRQAVNTATQRWQGGIEFIVYMNPEASEDQIEAVDRALAASPQVETFEFLDKDAAFEEFQQIFAEDSPELVDAVTPDALPTSFKVKPIDPDPLTVDALLAQFSQEGGVLKVVAATDAIRTIKKYSTFLSIGMFGIAIFLTAAALLFIGFTIQTAVFSRRREIEVMKLVGATNWFIRVPFMLEGVVQGVIGSALGITGIYAMNSVFESRLQPDDAIGLLSNFGVSGSQLLTTSVVLLLAAILFTAVASAVAVSFYVKV
jgi:cell division transport system permease protein